MKTFSYFNKPISEISDAELISWYVMFCNGADLSDQQDYKEFKEFKAECTNRDSTFNTQVD